MYIQYDRDEQDSMTCFTFDSTPEDQEQMRDLTEWLSGLGIRTSKTTIRAPGGGKMICLIVNNIMRETITPEPVQTPIKTSVPVKAAPTPAPVKQAPPKDESESESEDESESESEDDSEPVVPVSTKKPVVKSTTKK